MKMTMWLVRLASVAAIGSVTSAAVAQPKDAAKPGETKKSDADDSDGPFAPRGKTGKLRESVTLEEEEKARAEARHEPPPPPEKPGSAGIDMVYGFGKHGTGATAFDMKVFSFVLGATYQIDPTYSFRVRLPVSTGKITAGGDEYSSTTFGNLELAGGYTADLGTHTKLPIELALTAPIAGGDRFPPSDAQASERHYLVNWAARTSRGMEVDELFEPHRFGIIPQARLVYNSGAIRTGAFMKIPILIRAGGQDPPPPPVSQPQSYEIKSTVIEWVLGGQFFYGIVARKVDIGARAWITMLSGEFVETILSGLVQPSKLQFVVEPQVRANFGAVTAGLGFLLPIGGRLGGDQQVNGLRLMAAYAF